MPSQPSECHLEAPEGFKTFGLGGQNLQADNPSPPPPKHLKHSSSQEGLGMVQIYRFEYLPISVSTGILGMEPPWITGANLYK